jgi:uroporphyrinogen III methyltransferase/synthase
MGVENLPRIVEQLLANQISPDTPAALIERGSYSDQKTTVSTLGKIVQDAIDIRPPAVFIVGDVVRLRDEIKWFESLPSAPLNSLRIINTRPRDPSNTSTETLTSKLIKLGAEVMKCRH